MSDDIKSMIRNTVKEVMGVDITDYEDSRMINTISEWDSFNNLMLISRFQEENNIEFSAIEIENTQTVGDLISLVEGKLKEKQ